MFPKQIGELDMFRTSLTALAIAFSAGGAVAAPDATQSRTSALPPSCVVVNADGSCLVSSKQAKGNDFNDFFTREILIDYCLYRATTRNELRWCGQLGL